MPPTSHYLEANGLRIHYVQAGAAEAPPVLLIHGFPNSSHLWRNILPVLAKTHRAIAIDLPATASPDTAILLWIAERYANERKARRT